MTASVNNFTYPAPSTAAGALSIAPFDLNHSQFDCRPYLITPEVARHWLGRNIHNRRLSEIRVAAIAKDIVDGKWILNGATFSWSLCGLLIDGQHRLHAIDRAGIAVPSLVATGLARDAQETVDTGTKRTFADVLTLYGVPDASSTAAIVTKVWEWRTGSIQWAKEKPTVGQLLDVWASIPDIQTDVRRASAARKALRASGAVYGLASFLFRQIDETDAHVFFVRMIDGVGLSVGDPIHALRKVLIDNAAAKLKRRNPEILALIIKAWNHYRRGAVIKQLKWTAGGATPEAFPEPR